MAMRAGVMVTAIAALAMTGLAGAASAKITQYECNFEQMRARGGGWVGEIIILTEDDKTGEIIVFDPVIKYFVGKPIPARRLDETKARVTYTWEVNARVKDQSPRMKYTLSYFRNGEPAKIRVQPGGYDNVWSGQGTCKVTTK